MKNAPPLHSGETILHNHVPSQRVFKRAAVFLIAVSLLPTIAFAFAFDDSFWVIVPLFVTCLLLMQERFTMGRHRAWITNQRIIFQDRDIALADITATTVKAVYVRVQHSGAGKSAPIYYPADGPAVAQAIDAARKGEP